ncbi:MAG: hypothetical protein DRP96_08185 [Candidatus Neomarinimicrobiota bacterium]|nr:MAG: hypothetical protein DRP96_08185 [Candidatus Neomarinimicrobiota bacterium]
MNNTTKDIVRKVVKDVLERFAFMFVDEPDGSEKADWSDDILHAVISFNGEFRGRLSITAPVSFCTEVTANVLGIDPEENAGEMACDALRELINIICGELVVALYGNKPIFNLSIPTLDRIDSDRCRTLSADPNHLQFSADGTPILVGLSITE